MSYKSLKNKSFDLNSREHAVMFSGSTTFILFFLIANGFYFKKKKISLVYLQINTPPPPRSPPPTSSRSSSSRGGGASNASTCPLTRSDDTLCQLPPEIPREHLEVVQTLTKTHFGEVRYNVFSTTVSVCRDVCFCEH